MMMRIGNDLKSGARRWVDLGGWLLFLGWIVANFLFKPFPKGVTSIGVGAIVFSVAVMRFLAGGSISIFWLIIGVVFMGAGFGHISGIDFPFTSAALVVCGVMMLLNSRRAGI